MCMYCACKDIHFGASIRYIPCHVECGLHSRSRLCADHRKRFLQAAVEQGKVGWLSG